MSIKAILFACIGLMVSMGLTAQFMVKDMAELRSKQQADVTAAQPRNDEQQGSPAEPEGTTIEASRAANALREASTSMLACGAETGYEGCKPAAPGEVTLVDATRTSFVLSAMHQGSLLYASADANGTCHWVDGTPNRCDGW